MDSLETILLCWFTQLTQSQNQQCYRFNTGSGLFDNIQVIVSGHNMPFKIFQLLKALDNFEKFVD